ncbi:MAG: hypothetical protein KatS3mg009_3152 [Acidimicrobiia bacterium]|nr:MAG: hypothetical protein KatS3mg009_3152 [Acidimicrobiia bacterium]
MINTGAPVLLKEINDYLRGGMLTLGGIALAVMVADPHLFFRRALAALVARPWCSSA